MSENEISKGCLTHYDNRHIQTRVDFLQICAYDKSLFSKELGNKKEEPNQECMAKILRLFETLTDHARTSWQLKAINATEKGLTIPQEPAEYRFELTIGSIVELIYNTFGESTVRNSIDHLLHLGYIGRSQSKKNTIPVYWLNIPVIQSLLKKQAEQELSGFENTPSTIQGLKSHPKRPISNPNGPKSHPKRPISQAGGFEITPNNNSNKDNITEKDKKESGATAPTTTETSLSENTPAQECEQQEVTHPPEPEPPQQQALMAATPRASAKVEQPAPPAVAPTTKRRNTKGLPQLTLAGQHILELYDASKPIKRKTMLNADNIGRANRLAEAVERDEDFTEAVRLMRDDPFLKQKNIAVDLDFVDRKIEKYLMQVDQLREAAAQAEQARALAEERAKTARPPTAVKPTALEQHMRDMEARYLQGGK